MCLYIYNDKLPKNTEQEYCEAVSETDLSELKTIQNNFKFYDFEVDLSGDCTQEYKNGQFIKIYNKKYDRVEEIKKTTLCWYLNDEIRKPSSDRVRKYFSTTKYKKLQKIV